MNIYNKTSRLTDIDNILVVTSAEGEGVRGEIRVWD